MSATDYSSIKRIERETLNYYLRYLKRTRQKDTVDEFISPRYFEHYVKTTTSFVAVVKDEVVGFIFCKPILFMHGAERTLWLEQIMVLPESLRRGVGTQLLSMVIKRALKQGVNLMVATLNPNNIPSARLLAKLGFEVANWRKASKSLVPEKSVRSESKHKNAG